MTCSYLPTPHSASWSMGYDVSLSRIRSGFESRWGRHAHPGVSDISSMPILWSGGARAVDDGRYLCWVLAKNAERGSAVYYSREPVGEM